MGWKEMLNTFWQPFNSKVSETQELSIQQVIDSLNEALALRFFPDIEENKDARKCPSCGKGVLGLKLSKFGAFLGCSDYPECKYTRKLNSNDEAEGGSLDEPKLIGKDPKTELDITLRKGPYGFYLQLGEAVEKTKPKRFPVPKTYDPFELTEDIAFGLIQLPRVIGNHPEANSEIKAGIGRYGPYLLHEKKFTSIKDKEDDVLTIGINRALDILSQAPKGGKSKSGLERNIGKHPKSETSIDIYTGPYGKYIKYGKKNVRIPKGQEADTLTLEQAVEIIDKGKK